MNPHFSQSSPDTLVLVHPGSMYGSAAFSLGRDTARTCRENALAQVCAHAGAFIIIDGALSDEIPIRDQQMLCDCLSAAAARGHLALRLWGDDGEERPFRGWSGVLSQKLPADFEAVYDDQVAAANAFAGQSRGNWIEVTGAWASAGKGGCVNSVAIALRRTLPSVLVTVSATAVFEPDEEPAEDCEKQQVPDTWELGT